MPMRVIAKKRCRAMFEPPEKGERATLNPNLSTRLKPTFFRSGPWAAGWLLLVEEGERAALNFQRKDFEIVQQDQVRDPSPTEPRRLDTLSNVLSDVRVGSITSV